MYPFYSIENVWINSCLKIMSLGKIYFSCLLLYVLLFQPTKSIRIENWSEATINDLCYYFKSSHWYWLHRFMFFFVVVDNLTSFSFNWIEQYVQLYFIVKSIKLKGFPEFRTFYDQNNFTVSICTFYCNRILSFLQWYNWCIYSSARSTDIYLLHWYFDDSNHTSFCIRSLSTYTSHWMLLRWIESHHNQKAYSIRLVLHTI